MFLPFRGPATWIGSSFGDLVLVGGLARPPTVPSLPTTVRFDMGPPQGPHVKIPQGSRRSATSPHKLLIHDQEGAKPMEVIGLTSTLQVVAEIADIGTLTDVGQVGPLVGPE